MKLSPNAGNLQHLINGTDTIEYFFGRDFNWKSLYFYQAWGRYLKTKLTKSLFGTSSRHSNQSPFRLLTGKDNSGSLFSPFFFIFHHFPFSITTFWLHFCAGSIVLRIGPSHAVYCLSFIFANQSLNATDWNTNVYANISALFPTVLTVCVRSVL